jgi:hypothetical protein
MDPDVIFRIANLLALAGWLVLLASPLRPPLAERLSGLAIPLLLSVAYCGLVFAFWTSGKGGFSSLDSVARLFQTRQLLLAGWIHYLAFDLFVGVWIARTARLEGIPFWAVVPCLPATFLFGPAGFLLFNAIRSTKCVRAQTEPGRKAMS